MPKIGKYPEHEYRSEGDNMKTLLEEFFDNKISKHVEPKRVNVPRGEKIGFSRAKYEAALVCTLYNFNLKELADHLKGSYEVIRKWKTETDFKELCTDIFKEFIWNIDIELESYASDIGTKLLHQRSQNKRVAYQKFKDANLYSQEVIDHLEQELRRYLAMENGYLFLDMAHQINKFSGSPQLSEMLTQEKAKLRAKTIDMAIAALSNPETSEPEKKEVIALLQRLKK